MAYKKENGTCTITCDKCGKTDTANESGAGDYFYSMGWVLKDGRKYKHLCIDCLPAKYKSSVIARMNLTTKQSLFNALLK